jgi:protein-arginine kinase activator protein McsA
MGDRYCDVCTINAAMVHEIREFRNLKNAPEAREFLVCNKCSRLNNFWFDRILRAKNKQEALEELLEGTWDRWTTNENPKNGGDAAP